MKRIMLVTRNVQFAIDVKRALEALGEYSVTTVADVRNAMERLREHPQHLLLLDTADLSIAPSIMIEMVRSRREDIAIVLAPDAAETRELAAEYGAQGVVDIPVMARRLLPLLDAAIQETQGALEPTQETTALEIGEDTMHIESFVDGEPEDDRALNYTRRRLQASYELLHPPHADGAESAASPALEVLIEPDEESDTVRYRLVTETEARLSTGLGATEAELAETPALTREAKDTVSDLATSLAGAPAAEGRRTERAPGGDSDADWEDRASFEDMLNAILDESTALENLTLESLFDTTRELPGALGTGVVPAWLRETEQFIREPGFLEELSIDLPPLDMPALAGETTAPALESGPPAAEEAKRREAADDETDQHESDAAETALGELGAANGAGSRAPLWSRSEDPTVAQLALTMTQVMTELTADATVLTRDDQIVAFSGELPLEKFRVLRNRIGNDWTAQGGQSRIRFITLPENGRDYMLYSRGSVAEYTLTLIFAGGRQLRDIRRQGDRMLGALDASPLLEIEPAEQAETEASAVDLSAEANGRQPFAFVWTVDDAACLLEKQVAEQLVFWLEVQLNSLNWKIRRLDVHHDFIYLRADVPGRASPDALVRTVMDRARQIARSEDRSLPSDLWADAYLVLQPGRDMSERELQRFLQFARA